MHRPEIDFGLATQLMFLNNSDLSQRCGLRVLHTLDVTAHARLADVGTMLEDEPLPDPPAGVSLLTRDGLVVFEPTINELFPLIQLR